jgi:hypothetical protein
MSWMNGTRLQLRFFTFLRKFNADSPGFLEAQWTSKRISSPALAVRILKLRSKAQSLKQIAHQEKLSETEVRQILIKAATDARHLENKRAKL